MITDIFTYLNSSPVSGRPMTFQRDDDQSPFNDLAATPVLVRQQSGSTDRDITNKTYDIWLFTQANPSNSDIGALFSLANALEEHVAKNFTQDPIFNLDVVGGATGPFSDGQNRQAISLSITASSTTGKPL